MWEGLLAAMPLVGHSGDASRLSSWISGARADAYVMLHLNCQFAWISIHHGNTLLGISMRVFSEQFN